MLHLSRHDLRKHTTSQLRDLLEAQGHDTEVWRGDAGDLLIGDDVEGNEDVDGEYVLLGTVAEYLADTAND